MLCYFNFKYGGQSVFLVVLDNATSMNVKGNENVLWPINMAKPRLVFSKMVCYFNFKRMLPQNQKLWNNVTYKHSTVKPKYVGHPRPRMYARATLGPVDT